MHRGVAADQIAKDGWDIVRELQPARSSADAEGPCDGFEVISANPEAKAKTTAPSR